MKMQNAVEEYLVEIEVRKYTPKTIRSYRCNLNLFLRFCAEKLHVETVQRRLQRNENRSCCGSFHSRICSEMIAIGRKEAQVQVQPPSMTTLLPVM